MADKTDPLYIDVGAMRSKVSLLQPSSVGDSIGDTAEPTLFAQRWAAVSTLSGQEFYRSQQFTSEANRLVMMRWLPGVSAPMTVQTGTDGSVAFPLRRFTILYVENVLERNVKLNLFCKEVT